MTHHEPLHRGTFAGLSISDAGYCLCVLELEDEAVSKCRIYEAEADRTDLQSFLDEVRQEHPDSTLRIVMGFDDFNVGFYHFEVPAVADKQMAAVIAAQAEIHLPLPIDQMQTDWQILSRNPAGAEVVVAAAKRSLLQPAAALAGRVRPDAVASDSEALVRAVMTFGNPVADSFNLLYVMPSRVKLLFVRNGKLAKAMTFDCDSAVSEEPTPAMSLLCLDIQNAMAAFTGDSEDAEPLYLYGPGAGVESLEMMLAAKGLDAVALQIQFPPVSGNTDAVPDPVCLGLALIARGDGPALNLFDGLYRKETVDSRVKRTPGKKPLVAAVCLLLMLFVAISYGLDKYRLAEYEKQMNTPAFTQHLEMHRLRSTIARQRIDVPEIIEKINQSLPKGLEVVSLDIQRYRKIAVRGRCKDPKLMYTLAESLGQCTGVENVRISNQSFEEKKKLTVFTLTFDYKNFTDKKKAY